MSQLFLQVAFIARVKRHEFILFIKILQRYKRFALQFALKFVINISYFD